VPAFTFPDGVVVLDPLPLDPDPDPLECEADGDGDVDGFGAGFTVKLCLATFSAALSALTYAVTVTVPLVKLVGTDTVIEMCRE
jgi:hypothetical protein